MGIPHAAAARAASRRSHRFPRDEANALRRAGPLQLAESNSRAGQINRKPAAAENLIALRLAEAETRRLPSHCTRARIVHDLLRSGNSTVL